MKYLLLMYHTEGVFTEEEMPRERGRAIKTCHELHERKQFVAAAPLLPIATARSVRVRDGRTQVTDGPFAETKEQLGGYVLVDAPTIDEAVAMAAKFPAAERGTVEVRAIVELPNLPVLG
jgi:hypothetical protein